MPQLCILSNLTSEQWAAWVQAVGSVLAIAVAIYVSRRQYLDARALHREQARAQRLQTYASYRALLDLAMEEFRQALLALQGPNPEDYFDGWSTNDLFAQIYGAFKEIPVLSMPTYESTKSLIKLRDVFSTAAWNAAEGHKSLNTDNFQFCVDALRHNIQEAESLCAALQNDVLRLEHS